jgi:hypothetical protein
MAPPEQGDRQFKHPSLAAVECEFLSAFWHWAGSTQHLLIIGIFHVFPLNDNPGSTAGTCYARAQNAIGHSKIIRVIEGGRQRSPHIWSERFLVHFELLR